VARPPAAQDSLVALRAAVAGLFAEGTGPRSILDNALASLDTAILGTGTDAGAGPETAAAVAATAGQQKSPDGSESALAPQDDSSGSDGSLKSLDDLEDLLDAFLAPGSRGAASGGGQ
jgi:hypothetical protein